MGNVFRSVKCKYCAISVVILFGAILLTAGLVLPWYVGKQLSDGIKSMLVKDSLNTPGFAGWEANNKPDSVPYYTNFYLFNITNPQQVIDGTEKPKLQQVGPYSYRKYQVKFRITFPSDGNQAQYKTWTYYTFNPATSNGDPYTDKITTVNFPFQGVRSAVGTNWWQSLTFDIIASMEKTSIFVTLTPHELAWGMNYTILEFLANLQPGLSPNFGLQKNYTSQEEADNNVAFDIFSTGKDNIHNIQQYVKWQGNSSLTIWGSEEANRVVGTDATQYHPGLSKKEPLETFVSDVFRTGTILFTETAKIEGITMYCYVLNPDSLKNETEYPPNAAFYQYGPSGVANMTVTSSGTPVFLSKPHFLDADPFYLNAVEGLSPDREKHDTRIYVEPITGATMSAHKRLQINVFLEPQLLLYPNLKEVYMPVGYIEETSTISSDLAKAFKGKVYFAMSLQRYSRFIGIIVGGFFLGIGVILLIAMIYKNRKSDGRGSYSAIN